MSIFNILKSDTFASTLSSTLQSFSGKAREMADTVSHNMPSSWQDAGAKAKDVATNIGNKLPDNTGKILGVGALAALASAILPKGVVKSAALVGVGAIAMNFYQKWSASQKAGEQQPAESSVATAALPSAQDPAAILMLRAMVYAARADGHIDQNEQQRIAKLTEQFLPGQDTRGLVATLVNEPLNLDLLASQMHSQEQREDLYRLSCLVLDIDHFMERGYLDALASAMGIDKTRQAGLEAEAAAAKQQLDAM